MTLETTDKLRERLREIAVELQKVLTAKARVEVKLKKLDRERETLIDALKYIREEIPELDQGDISVTAARRRKGGKLRAADVLLQVVSLGEEIRPQEVVERVVKLGLDWTSSNPKNAIATAIARSPEFESAGRGVYRRIPIQGNGNGALHQQSERSLT